MANSINITKTGDVYTSPELATSNANIKMVLRVIQYSYDSSTNTSEVRIVVKVARKNSDYSGYTQTVSSSDYSLLKISSSGATLHKTASSSKLTEIKTTYSSSNPSPKITYHKDTADGAYLFELGTKSNPYIIKHNTDGTASISFTIEPHWTHISPPLNPTSTSGANKCVVNFITIPLKSSLSTTKTNFVLNTTDSISMTLGVKNTSFKHKIKATLGGYSYSETIPAGTTSYVFTPTQTAVNNWLSKITDSNLKNYNLVLVLSTYNGSTLIGEANKVLSISLSSYSAPQFSIYSIMPVTSIIKSFRVNDGYVVSYNRLSVSNVNLCLYGKSSISMSASRVSNISKADLSKLSISDGNTTLSISNPNSSTIPMFSRTLNPYKSGTIPYSISMTDIRGQGTTASKNIICRGYNKPDIKKITCTIDESGILYLTTDGSVNTVYNTDGSKNNTYIQGLWAVRYKKSSNSAWSDYIFPDATKTTTSTGVTTLTPKSTFSNLSSAQIATGLEAGTNYDVEVSLYDIFGSSVTSTTTIDSTSSEVTRLINFGNNGTSIAIGKKVDIIDDSTGKLKEKTFDVDYETYFRKPMNVGTDSIYMSSLSNSSSGSVLIRDSSDGKIYIQSSARKYKDDISYDNYDSEKMHEIINQLKPATFKYKGSDDVSLGFIADDIAELDNSLVTYNYQGEVENFKDRSILALLVNEVQRQNKLIETLFAIIQNNKKDE